MAHLVEGIAILGREIQVYDTGYRDNDGREITYETTIEAIADVVPSSDGTYLPRSWRVVGRQLRNGQPFGRHGSPRHAYSVREARTLGRTLFHRHCRYVERKTAIYQVRAAAAEEDLDNLALRI